MSHCQTQIFIANREFAPLMAQAVLLLLRREHGREIIVIVIDVCDSEHTGPGERLGAHEYEALLAAHAPLTALQGLADEWDAIAVSYTCGTTGTTGDAVGVVTHHRGADLNAVCNAATWTMPHFPRCLWTCRKA